MSTTVDQRVVEMQFDNRNFENNVSTTMSTLDKLKQSLKLGGASKGFEEIGAAANGVNMSGLGRAVETVQAKFSALSVIGVTALANITNSAVNAGKRIISALTIDPIKTGFQEYETQINSVQTILANTESKGSTINDVNKALDTLNLYADKTIYNFTQMTRNIGTFTAAGVSLETSVKAIQGIANMAAVSGSTSQQASTAMYQLSQALASGTVKLMDWNSVVNAGMGGQVFQDALKETSRQMVKNAEALSKMGSEQKKAWQESHGYTDDQMKKLQEYSFNVDEIIKKNGSFRESLSEGWITAEVLTQTLGKMTKSGVVEYVADMTGASKESVIELQNIGEEIGYNSKEFENLALSVAKGDKELAKSVTSTLKMANTAEDAATKVKTLTQLWDTLKEAAQSGWTQTWETVVGDFEEAKELYTRISDAVGGMIAASADYRNKILGEGLSSGWKQFINTAGADEKILQDAIISTAKKAGVSIDELIEKNGSFSKSLKEGWMTSDILKNSINDLAIKTKGLTDEQLTNIGYTREQATAIQKLNEKVQNGEIDLDNFAKSMSRISGRENIIEGFANVFKNLLKVIKPVREAFRDIFPSITGEQVYSLTERFRKFTEGITVSDETVDKIKRTFKGLFSILDIGKKTITAILKPLLQLATSSGISSFGDLLLSTAANIGDFFTSLNEGFNTDRMVATLSSIVSDISGFFTKLIDKVGGFSGVFSSVGNTIVKVAKSIWNAVTKVFGWIKENVSWGDILAGLTGGGIFVVFKKVSGFIDKIKETFEGFFNKDKGESIKSKFSDILDSVKESLQSFTSGIKVASLIGIAASITLLSSSFKKISELDAKGIAKSLITIGVSLTMMMKALNAMPKNKSFVTDLFGMSESTNLVKSGVSLILMAEAIKILSDSIVKLSELSLSEIAKGLIGVGGGMVVLVKGLNAIKAAKIPIRTSIAMLALAESCKALGDAFAKFSEFSWDEIARGLVSMGGALGELVAAMAVLEKASGFSSIIGSAGILVTIQGLGDLADALKKFGEMNWDEIGKGLIAMGGALGELTVVLGVLSKISKISIGAGASGGITGALSNKLFGKAGVSLGGSGSFSAQLSGLSNIFSSGSIWITIQGLSKLAESLKSFGGMSWDSIGKGLSAMGGALAEVGGVTAAVGKLAGFSSILGAGSIWITIQGLGDLADSFKKFGSMSWGEIVRGLAAMGGALVQVGGVTGALGYLTNFAGILGAGAIWIAIQGLGDLADSFKKFGSMSWGEIVRGLAAMGGALVEVGVVTGALGYLTNFAGILGAGTIWIAIQGLDELANALKKFGEMDWGEIGRGLTAMGAALAEVAVGSLLNTLSGLGAMSLRTVAEPLGALADSIKKWTDVDIPIGLGVKLSYLAMGVQAFTFGGLGAGAIALVAKPLGVMAESVGKWSGVKVPSDIGIQLSNLALGVMAFTFDGLGAAALYLAAPAIGVMAESVSKWSGVTVPDNLKEDLGSLADGVKAFSWAFLGGWSIGAIVEPLRNLAGSVRVWKNVTIPSSLGEDLSTLAKGVRSFSFAFLGGWSIGAVVEPLKSLAGSVTAWKGVSIPGNIGEDLGSLADGIEAFSFAFVGGWVLDDIVDPLGRLAGSMDAWKGVSVPDEIGTQLSELAGGVRAFTLDGLGASAISELADPLGNLSESVQKWVGVNIPDSLTENLENLAKGVRSFTLDGLGANAIGEVSGPLGELADSVGKWSSVTIPNEFSKNLGSLADGVGKFTLVGFGASAIASVGTPLGNLADSIKKWDGVSIPSEFGTKLGELAEGVQAFKSSDSSSMILSDAATGLDVMSDSIRKWQDVKIPSGLRSQLESLSTGVLAFCGEGLSDNALADSAGPIGVLADSIRKWTGVTVPEGLSTQLTSLAEGVKAFCGEGFGDNALATSAAPLGDLADSIGKWSGVTVPDGLSTQLISLAEGVMAFCGEEMGYNQLGSSAGPLGTLADSVSKWSGVTVPSDLKENLTSLAEGVKAFATDEEGSNLLASSVGPIGTLADSIKKWSDVTVPENLSTQLSSLAEGVKAFTFDGSGDAASALVTAAPGIGTLADSIKKWSDVTVPENLSTQLTSLAEGVKAFISDSDGVNILGESAVGVGTMADSIRKWSDVTVPETLPSQLTLLAEGVKAFASEGGTNILGESAVGVGTMADSIRKWAEVTVPETLPSQLTSLAEGVKAFTTYGGSNILSESATGIGSMADSIKKWSGVTVPDSLSSDLTSLATGVKAFEGISSVPTGVSAFEKINSAASAASGLSFSTIISGLNDLVSSLSNFESVPSSISGVGEAIINNIVTPLQSALPIISNAGIEIVNALSTGITANAPSIQPASLVLVSAMLTTINSKAKSLKSTGSILASMFASGIRSRSSSARAAGSSLGYSASSGARTGYTPMYGAGSYIVDGLVKGINDNRDKVFNAVEQLANDLSEKFKITVLIGSPSKLFAEYGRFLDEGLAIGIEDNTNIPVTAASRLGESTIQTMQDAISKASDMFNFEGDLQPTIRPVVDLSDVKTGLSAIDGIFRAGKDLGVMANVRAISSSMNARSQNGANDDIISAINKLGAGLENNRGDTYNFGDFTYDDGSNVADAVGTLIRYAKIGRRV